MYIHVYIHVYTCSSDTRVGRGGEGRGREGRGGERGMIPSGASPGRDSCTHERRGEKEMIPSLISGASPGRDSCTHDYLEAHPWEGITK